MDLLNFIDTYNHSGIIILLEGKRNVKEEDKLKLKSLGKMLAEKLPSVPS